MADEQRFTMEEWAARVKELRQQARSPLAKLTPDECRDAYLGQVGEHRDTLAHEDDRSSLPGLRVTSPTPAP